MSPVAQSQTQDLAKNKDSDIIIHSANTNQSHGRTSGKTESEIHSFALQQPQSSGDSGHYRDTSEYPIT